MSATHPKLPDVCITNSGSPWKRKVQVEIHTEIAGWPLLTDEQRSLVQQIHLHPITKFKVTAFAFFDRLAPVDDIDHTPELAVKEQVGRDIGAIHVSISSFGRFFHQAPLQARISSRLVPHVVIRSPVIHIPRHELLLGHDIWFCIHHDVQKREERSGREILFHERKTYIHV